MSEISEEKYTCAVTRFIYVWEGPVRVSHWLNFICIIILSVTGAYIHYPFIQVTGGTTTPYVMGWFRFAHYLTGMIFILSILVRALWFFIGGAQSSFRGIPSIFKKNDRKTFFAYLKYYIFLRKNVPHTLGHNPVAVAAYIVLFTLFILQIITGLALWAQYNPNGLLYSMFGWVFGMVSNQSARFYHYILMYFIGGFVINHIYSAVIFDFKTRSGEISSIFSGWKPERVGK